MRDIVIDNCIAKNFCNPITGDLRTFVTWLRDHGTLAVTQRLLVEYYSSTGSATSATNICALIEHLKLEKRFVRFSKTQLEEVDIPQHYENRMRCNFHDRSLVRAVALTVRRIAISDDDNFRYDVNNLPGYNAVAVRGPAEIDYTASRTP